MNPVEWNVDWQGAESTIASAQYANIAIIRKQRFQKKYRSAQLDATLTRERIRAELRAIIRMKQKCADLSLPTILHVTHNDIIMTQVDGDTLSQYLQNCKQDTDCVTRALGQVVARMHASGVIHGDMTTSNFIVNQATDSIVPIDFGLSSLSTSAEDRAVDLYVLERALITSQHNINFDLLLDSYSSQLGTSANEVLKRLHAVRLRGRKRLMVG